MKLPGGDVDVRAGTGVRDGDAANPFIPLVRMKVAEKGGSPVELHLIPEQARRIGLDLIAAASMAWADTGIRGYAKDHGLDGDSIVGSVTALVDIALEHEGP